MWFSFVWFETHSTLLTEGGPVVEHRVHHLWLIWLVFIASGFCLSFQCAEIISSCQTFSTFMWA